MFCGWLSAGCTATSPRSESLAPPLISYPGTNSFSKNLHSKDSPFYKYDSAVVAAVEKKWYDILDSKNPWPNKTGKVVVQFHLNSDGTVSDVKILENHAGELLGYVCERAIKSCSPFEHWSPEMLKMAGKDYLEVNFTFYYY